MSLEWTSRTARTYAIANKRPAVARVAPDLWAMYPANRQEKVFYVPTKDNNKAMITTVMTLVAMDQWGIEPIIVDKLVVSERKQT